MVQGSVSKPSVSAGIESPADIFKGSPQRANNESAISKQRYTEEGAHEEISSQPIAAVDSVPDEKQSSKYESIKQPSPSVKHESVKKKSEKSPEKQASQPSLKEESLKQESSIR